MQKIHLLAALCGLLMLGGCSGNQLIINAPGRAAADSTFYAETLRLGTSLEVLLLDGTREKGELRAILANGLVLGRPSNYGLEEVICPFDRIVKVKGPGRELSGAHVAGNIVVGMLAGMALLLTAATWSLSGSHTGCN